MPVTSATVLPSAPRPLLRLAVGLGGLLIHVFLLLVPPVLVAGSTRGLEDLPTLAFLVLASAFLLADLPAGLRRPERVDCARRVDETAARFVTTGAAFVMLLLFWLALVEHAALGPRSFGALAMSGAAFMAAGVSFRFAAVMRLGHYFVSGINVRIGQPLLQDGPYGIVRHPSEIGNLFLVFGAAIMLESKMSLVLGVAFLLPLTILRISLEDRVLEQAFGAEFRRYALRVKRLVPYLY